MHNTSFRDYTIALCFIFAITAGVIAIEVQYLKATILAVDVSEAAQ